MMLVGYGWHDKQIIPYDQDYAPRNREVFGEAWIPQVAISLCEIMLIYRQQNAGIRFRLVR